MVLTSRAVLTCDVAIYGLLCLVPPLVARRARPTVLTVPTIGTLPVVHVVVPTWNASRADRILREIRAQHGSEYFSILVVPEQCSGQTSAPLRAGQPGLVVKAPTQAGIVGSIRAAIADLHAHDIVIVVGDDVHLCQPDALSRLAGAVQDAGPMVAVTCRVQSAERSARPNSIAVVSKEMLGLMQKWAGEHACPYLHGCVWGSTVETIDDALPSAHHYGEDFALSRAMYARGGRVLLLADVLVAEEPKADAMSAMLQQARFRLGNFRVLAEAVSSRVHTRRELNFLAYSWSAFAGMYLAPAFVVLALVPHATGVIYYGIWASSASFATADSLRTAIARIPSFLVLPLLHVGALVLSVLLTPISHRRLERLYR